MSVRFIHVVVILFYCCIVIPFYEYSTIHLPVILLVTFGLFGLFHFRAIENNADKNILVPVFWCKNIQFSTRYRSGSVAGLQGMHISFSKYCQTVFESDCTSFMFLATVYKIFIVLHLYQYVLLSVLKF